MKDGWKPECPEKTPNDELQKMPQISPAWLSLFIRIETPLDTVNDQQQMKRM